jgi:Calcineurin-like phosphoesterase
MRPGVRTREFSWMNPRPLLESRNDRLARWFDDPTNRERERWMESLRRKRGDDFDPDLRVTRYADEEKLSFLVLGDTGEGDASQYHVIGPALSQSQGTRFTFIVSDVIYPAGDVNEYYDKFYWPYQKLPGPVYAVPGNHDWYDGLHGFMIQFCGADPDLRPPAAAGRRRWREKAREVLWREPSEPDQERLEEMRKLRTDALDQPGPYLAIELKELLLVGIDTGIEGTIDSAQADWLERVSQLEKNKILFTGKPMVVDAEVKTEIPVDDDSGRTVKATVDDPGNRYIAVIGGDIHNYQRYPVRMADGRRVQHLVSGAGGAYTKATHKIPPARPGTCGCTEDEFRCYPRRGDSLAAYSRLYDQRFGFDKGLFRISETQAPAIMARMLKQAAKPTREGDQDVQVSRWSWWTARLIHPLPGSSKGPLHANFSELLDWNDPPPPLFKSFLRVDTRPGEIEIRCFAATGCQEHLDTPPLEDWLKGTHEREGVWAWETGTPKPDGTWTWTRLE